MLRFGDPPRPPKTRRGKRARLVFFRKMPFFRKIELRISQKKSYYFTLISDAKRTSALNIRGARSGVQDKPLFPFAAFSLRENKAAQFD